MITLTNPETQAAYAALTELAAMPTAQDTVDPNGGEEK